MGSINNGSSYSSKYPPLSLTEERIHTGFEQLNEMMTEFSFLGELSL